MKNKLLLVLAITTVNASFSMGFISNLFGFNSARRQPTEIEKLTKQMRELCHIRENLISTINETFTTYKKNHDRLNANDAFVSFSGRGIGDRSKSINICGIDFDLMKKEDVIHFTIANMLDERSTVLGEFTINKALYDDGMGERLYSHCLDVFDAIVHTIDKYESGFAKDLSDPRTVQSYPETVAHLRPQPIAKSESIEQAVERLNEVMDARFEQIKERVKQMKENE